MTKQEKLDIVGSWEFYLLGTSTTQFEGTYLEYLEYCERTNDYADGRYCSNYSGFRPNVYDDNNNKINYTAEAWVEIENQFAKDEAVETPDLNDLGFWESNTKLTLYRGTYRAYLNYCDRKKDEPRGKWTSVKDQFADQEAV